MNFHHVFFITSKKSRTPRENMCNLENIQDTLCKTSQSTKDILVNMVKGCHIRDDNTADQYIFKDQHLCTIDER